MRGEKLGEIYVKRKRNEDVTNSSPEKMFEASTVLVIVDRDVVALTIRINKWVIC
jgi:hypothetical protein